MFLLVPLVPSLAQKQSSGVQDPRSELAKINDFIIDAFPKPYKYSAPWKRVDRWTGKEVETLIVHKAHLKEFKGCRMNFYKVTAGQGVSETTEFLLISLSDVLPGNLKFESDGKIVTFAFDLNSSRIQSTLRFVGTHSLVDGSLPRVESVRQISKFTIGVETTKQLSDIQDAMMRAIELCQKPEPPPVK